jgi:hypothetical protein
VNSNIALYILIGVGIIISTVYFILCYHNKLKPAFPSIVTFFVSSVGINAGLKVCILTFDKIKITNLSENERIYIFIGGLAVIWASVTSIINAFKKSER